MTLELERALAAELGQTVETMREISGGDINRAFHARLADGAEVFVKHRPQAPPGMYSGEAHGLTWLAAAGAIRVPRVIAARDEAPAFLALEWIAHGAPAADHDERLGRGLAELHRSGAPVFGLDRDNMLATISLDNTPTPTWAEFYARRRLEPLVADAVDTGALPASSAARWARLFDRMPDLCGPTEPPARLHGDLWGGNAVVDAAGGPVLVDPAVFGGHREVDLAMMQLFGGFSPRVFAAYDELTPRADGHGDRLALYQLLPLLVHVILFGASYRARLEQALASYV